MLKMNDRAILVPIYQDDLIKTANILPRKGDELGYVTVGLKRQMKLKKFEKCEYVRWRKVNEALRWLQANHNEYKNVPIEELEGDDTCEWVKVHNSEDEFDFDSDCESDKSFHDNCETSSDSNEDIDTASTKSNQGLSSDMSQSCNDDSSSNDQMSTSSIQNSLPDVQMISSNDITMDTASQCSSQPGDRSKPDKNVEDKNEFLGVTCLLPDEPGQYVITNNTNKTIKKQMTRGGKILELAPGENRIPNDFLRDHKLEILAFPYLFPDGQFSLTFESRPIKLTPHKYFAQRILNKDTRFAQCPEYIFVAQQFVERFDVERQINIAMRTGKVCRTEDGMQMITDQNVWEVYKSIPGTPSYWRLFRNEIFAR